MIKLLKINQIKTLAQQILGVENYYKEFYALEEDVTFFTMYANRNRKSKFQFAIKIMHENSYNAFELLYKRYANNIRYLEDTFAEYAVLQYLIKSIYENIHQLTPQQKAEIIHYFEQYGDFKIDDVIGDFIGCSRGYASTHAEVERLRKEISNKNISDQE